MNSIPKITRLSPAVYRILGCNPGPMTLQGTNTYLIGTGKKRILLDTGDGEQPEYIDLLRSVLSDQQVSLDHIILTHWHPDHVGGVQPIKEKINSQCTVMKYHVDDKPASFEKLTDGQEFTTDGASLRVIHTPGHTKDHVILHFKEENAVFSGDCILGEGTAVFEDLYDYMKSLDIILGLNPSIIYPGHGPVVEDPVKKITYYITHRNQRETQILEFLNKQPRGTSLTAMDIVRGIYTDLDPNLYGAAEHNVLMHLKKLEKEARVNQAKSNVSLWSSI